MMFEPNEFADDRDNHRQEEKGVEPNAYRIEDEHNLEEKDLKRSFLFGSDEKLKAHPTEGQGIGGQSFGKESQTPAGDDKNNPSQNAGYTNAYFARNEPSDEHPEDSNFTARDQEGSPDYSKAQPQAENTEPKPEKVERGNGENDRPHPQQPYTEGTDDNDGNNISGPEELPDQQKVGEDDDRGHIET